MTDATIRFIQIEDNSEIAAVIRQVLTEFGANRPGFAWQDPELDSLFETYQVSRCRYLVVESDGRLVGGAGIAPLPHFEQETCELQKMYLLPEFRGAGIGETLLTLLLEFAREQRFDYCYLETLVSMQKANALYGRFNFKALPEPLTETGHSGCDKWMIKRL